MYKKYLIGLFVTALASMIITIILTISVTYLPLSVPVYRMERIISKIQKGPNQINKQLLLDCYKKHLNFENKLRARDLAYVKLIKTLSVAYVFIILIQLFLAYRLLKEWQEKEQ